jgi:putative ABC transport system ATP-binding protein
MKLIEVKNMSKGFSDESGNFDILNEVNFEILEGTLNIVLGASGSGKTTLLNIIDGIESVSSGEVLKKEGLKIGYVTQHANFIEELTVEQNLIFAVFKKRKEVDIRGMCSLLGCDYLLSKKTSSLSGGEKQRINIIRALLSNPDLIILDEPTASLDHDNKLKVMSFLKSVFEDKKATLIIVTHDQEVVDYFTNKKVLRLKNKSLLQEF